MRCDKLNTKLLSLSSIVILCLSASFVSAQTDWKKGWERALQEAKKEAKVVVGIPARPELRKQLGAGSGLGF